MRTERRGETCGTAPSANRQELRCQIGWFPRIRQEDAMTVTGGALTSPLF